MDTRQPHERATDGLNEDESTIAFFDTSRAGDTTTPVGQSLLSALDQLDAPEVAISQHMYVALEQSGRVRGDAVTETIATIPAPQLVTPSPASQELAIGNFVQISTPASPAANAAVAPDVINLAGSKIVFHNTYGSGVTAAFHQAVIDAEHFIEAHFTASATVDLFASFDFASLGPKFSGENNFLMYTESYAAWRAQMVAHATTADDAAAVAALPINDPTGGLGVSLPSGYARMMGMNVGNDVDAIVLNSDLTFNFTNGDATGVLEHELSEGAMGRVSSLGFRSFTSGGHYWNPMDFFRFTAGGAHDFTGGKDGVTTFFGFDSSHVFTNFQYHNSINAQGQYDGFDLADWDHTVGDSFGPGGPGSPGTVSITDLRVMDVLGWTPTGSPATLTASLVNSIYHAVLARNASQAEINTALATDVSSGDAAVVSAIVNSTEAQQNVYPVIQVIKLALGNFPTAAQLAGWVPFVESAGGVQGNPQIYPLLDQMAKAFVASTNFGNVYNNGTLVNPDSPVTAHEMQVIIQAATGIASTPAQVATWVGTGLTVNQVFVEFALGDQYTAFSKTAVQQYLTAAADNAVGITVAGISGDIQHMM